jgi:hypothetical protein
MAKEKSSRRILKAYGTISYLSELPRELSPNRIIAHNHVEPQKVLGHNGFRAWTDSHREVDKGTYILCDCGCWGDLVHYCVNR